MEIIGKITVPADCQWQRTVQQLQPEHKQHKQHKQHSKQRWDAVEEEGEVTTRPHTRAHARTEALPAYAAPPPLGKLVVQAAAAEVQRVS